MADGCSFCAGCNNEKTPCKTGHWFARGELKTIAGGAGTRNGFVWVSPQHFDCLLCRRQLQGVGPKKIEKSEISCLQPGNIRLGAAPRGTKSVVNRLSHALRALDRATPLDCFTGIVYLRVNGVYLSANGVMY
jgi:hypothetical protein